MTTQNGAVMRNGTYYKGGPENSPKIKRASKILPFALWAFGLVFTLINSFVRPYMTLNWFSFIIILVFSALLTAPTVIIEWKLGIRKAYVTGLGICHFLAFLLPFVMGAAFETFYMWFTAVAGVFVCEINYRADASKNKAPNRRNLCIILFAATSLVVMIVMAIVMPLSNGVRLRANKDGGYSVIAATNAKSIEVPSTVRGKAVTGVEAFAFSRNVFTRKVVLPESVTDMQYLSFTGMEHVVELTLSPSALPDGMMYGLWFEKDEDAASVANALVPESITKITVIGSVTDSCFNLMTHLAEVEFQGNVKRIGSSAFAGCTSLKAVAIPETVTVIDSYAFSYCRALTDVTLPSSLKSIETLAFQYCTALRSLVIPANVTYVGAGAFDHCSGSLLKIECKLTYEDTVTYWNTYWTYQIQSYDESGNPSYTSQVLNVTYATITPIEK